MDAEDGETGDAEDDEKEGDTYDEEEGGNILMSYGDVGDTRL